MANETLPGSANDNSSLPGVEKSDALDDPEFHKMVQEEMAKLQGAGTGNIEVAKNNLWLMRGNVKVWLAQNLRGEIVTDQSWAPIFAANHQNPTINRSFAIIDAVLSGLEDKKRNIRKLIKSLGLFLDLNYDDAFELARLQNPADPKRGGWVMSIARGQPISEDTFALLPDMVGGFAEVYVMPDNPKAKLKSELILEEGRDVIEDGEAELYMDLLNNPAIIAWLSDVCSLRGQLLDEKTVFEGHGFASTATDTAHRYIEQVINPHRKNKIRWSLAAIAEVEGLANEQGEIIEEFSPPMKSVQSMALHTRDRRVGDRDLESHILGTQKRRLMKVVYPHPKDLSKHIVFYVVVNWKIVAQELAS